MWQLKDCTQRMQCVKCWAECKGVCAKYCATNVACTLNDEKCSVQCGPTKLHETSHASASHASAIYMHLMCVCARLLVLRCLVGSSNKCDIYLSLPLWCFLRRIAKSHLHLLHPLFVEERRFPQQVGSILRRSWWLQWGEGSSSDILATASRACMKWELSNSCRLPVSFYSLNRLNTCSGPLAQRLPFLWQVPGQLVAWKQK